MTNRIGGIRILEKLEEDQVKQNITNWWIEKSNKLKDLHKIVYVVPTALLSLIFHNPVLNIRLS